MIQSLGVRSVLIFAEKGKPAIYPHIYSGSRTKYRILSSVSSSARVLLGKAESAARGLIDK